MNDVRFKLHEGILKSVQNVKEGLENINENIRNKTETIEETYERFSTDCVHKCNFRSKRKSIFHH